MKTVLMISIIVSQVAAIVLFYTLWIKVIEECSKNNIKNT
jgi:hypothetical protein